MSKIPIESDLFADERDEWLVEARKIQYKLEIVKNPYVGNKRKMLVDFAKVFYDLGLKDVIKKGKVLDLFAGSAFVGYFFKRMGAAVWSNDLLASSFLNSLILIECERNRPANRSVESFFSPKTLSTSGCAQDYVGVRFSKEEAESLDSFCANIETEYGWSIRQRIEKSSDPRKIESFGEHVHDGSLESFMNSADDNVGYEILAITQSVIHYVMDRCYVGGRLNNGQVLAEVSHRLAHARNQGCEMKFSRINPYWGVCCNNGRRSIATKMDAVQLLESHCPDVDLIYIDPPYGGDQSDYSEMYDFFEKFVGYDRPETAERFAAKKRYEENFIKLVSHLPPKSIWTFSYNDDSWESCDRIKAIIQDFERSEIIVKEVDYRYKYRSKEKSSGTEYLIVALP